MLGYTGTYLATALRIFGRVRFPPRPKIERSDAWTQFVDSLERVGSAIC